jgi:hypothetical protein
MRELYPTRKYIKCATSDECNCSLYGTGIYMQRPFASMRITSGTTALFVCEYTSPEFTDECSCSLQRTGIYMQRLFAPMSIAPTCYCTISLPIHFSRCHIGGYMNAFESERQFANAIDENPFSSSTSNRTGRSSLQISKWGTVCWPPFSGSRNLQWNCNLGGTIPSQIFEERSTLQRPLSSEFWCIFTDGEVDKDEVERLHAAA